MFKLPTSPPDSLTWYEWFQNFVNNSEVRISCTDDGRRVFVNQIDTNLAKYNAKWEFVEDRRSVIVFENEQDATFFILKWSK